jgi:hypothetical protein
MSHRESSIFQSRLCRPGYMSYVKSHIESRLCSPGYCSPGYVIASTKAFSTTILEKSFYRGFREQSLFYESIDRKAFVEA